MARLLATRQNASGTAAGDEWVPCRAFIFELLLLNRVLFKNLVDRG
jgi:hypothetical protein